ncbi:MAG: ribbon-helix-helix protein, CopG family [Dehalococcoidales bacterium]|nr:ribbon-helix-helix protein, CopG family [Dehalococcoidales bacterium]
MVSQTKRSKDSISITVDPDLIAIVDEIRKETNTTRSGVISKCLEELARKRKEELMIKYYETMAKEHRNSSQKPIKVLQDIASSWGD